MSESSIAIVGSGVAAAAIASVLVRHGHDVVLFEKGPEYSYPHGAQFTERWYRLFDNPMHKLPHDLNAITVSGGYHHSLNWERAMVVGGSTTHWGGIAIRMHATDFQTRSRYGFGADWPIGYQELEPYYCEAERFLGVSGTDVDNPFAPPRSQPYPLPCFELTNEDRDLAERLRQDGIVVHTTPQARTRRPFDGRPACQNFGTCEICPIGARYSASHHLVQLQASGRCQIWSNVSVRRVVADMAARRHTLVYRPNGEAVDREHAAKVVIVAAGAIECARLLLLSRDAVHPNGIGNQAGHVGRNLVFHHLWDGTLRYDRRMNAGRQGPATGMCHQFRDPPQRGRHGGVQIELSANNSGVFERSDEDRSGAQVMERLRHMPNSRGIEIHAESDPGTAKYVALSIDADRFGDPFAHVHYEPSELDRQSYRFVAGLVDRFAHATGGELVRMRAEEQFTSGAHHMGTCRMGSTVEDSVVDSFGRVHGVPSLYVAGSAIFASGSGAVPPTLTLVALALRSAKRILRDLD